MKNYIYIIITIIIISLILFLPIKNKETDIKIYTVDGTITNSNDDYIILQDKNNKNYTFNNIKEKIGTDLSINCAGNKNDECKMLDYKVINESIIPDDYLDEGIFKDYYYNAFLKLKELNIDEKIGQILLSHYPEDKQIEIQNKYQLGGYIFFAKDFANKTKDEVIQMINDLQNNSKIPILTAVDEEGGTVSRISNNKNLVEEPFLSPQELYSINGFEKIKEDVILKSKILKELGLNLNLAPVVDVSTNEDDYIYKRTIGLNTELTSIYASTVIEASKNTGVSYTLKHFPGYSNNIDTHKSISVDLKSYEDILNIDIPPFKKGIEAGAEVIMNSHNIVSSIDAKNPASLSKDIHNILRNDLNYTGIIITDDLNMHSLDNIKDKEIKAINAGNDILITDNYLDSFNNIKKGIENNKIDLNLIDKIVFRILAFKYYKGLL